MDFELFFGTPRFKILEILANEPKSPIEIAKELGTSVSYVSQQLKLLEAGMFITKEKTGSVEKGKPRTVFSLSKEILQLSVLINKMPFRKVLVPTEYHKVILRIWALENHELHYYIEKFYWHIENELKEIKAIFLMNQKLSPRILIFTDSKKLKNKIDSFQKDIDNALTCEIVPVVLLEKYSEKDIHPIHDPELLFSGEKLKGGTEDETK